MVATCCGTRRRRSTARACASSTSGSATSIADGKPLNEFARELIAARGSTYQNPPANFYRALRDPYARAEAVAQVFLGVRVQCAKCHNHPFDRWTQDDYHEFAAFFARIDYRVLENNRRDQLDKHEFDGEQIVFLDRDGELKHPRTRRGHGAAARSGHDRPAAGRRSAARRWPTGWRGRTTRSSPGPRRTASGST